MVLNKRRWGIVLRELRLEKGLSQTALAERSTRMSYPPVKIHRVYITQLEHGYVKQPQTPELRAALLAGLGITEAEFECHRARVYSPCKVPLFEDFPLLNNRLSPCGYITVALPSVWGSGKSVIQAFCFTGSGAESDIKKGDILVIDAVSPLSPGNTVVYHNRSMLQSGRVVRAEDGLCVKNASGTFILNGHPIARVLQVVRNF